MLNTISGGAFRDLEGSPLANGYLTLELSHDEQDTNTPAQVTAGLRKRVPLDNNGNVAGTVSVEVNSTLLPANSYYIVNAYRHDGTKAWKSAQNVQVPASPTPYNIGNWIPTNPPGSSFSGGGGETSILLETNGVANGDQLKLNLVAGSNMTITDDGSGDVTFASSGGGGSSISLETNGTPNSDQAVLNLIAGTNVSLSAGLSGGVTINAVAAAPSNVGYVALENGVPDQTGNSYYAALSLTSWFVGHWEYVAGQSSYATFCMRLPAVAPTSASIILEVFSGDATAGHTANFQTSDAVVNTGTLNVGSLTSASAQTYTTSTAYARSTLTFAVQSSLVNNGLLIIKVATVTSGTHPTTNMYVLPYLKLVP